MMPVGTQARSPGGKRLGFRYQTCHSCHWPGPGAVSMVGRGGACSTGKGHRRVGPAGN